MFGIIVRMGNIQLNGDIGQHQVFCNQILFMFSCHTSCKEWHNPPSGFLKCNTDAAIFSDTNSSGLIGCVIRDETGRFVACRVQQMTVKECEALNSLLQALIRPRGEPYPKVIFGGCPEFGLLVQSCREIHHYNNCDYSVSFVRRQANVATHTLARAPRSHVSPTVFFHLPHFLVIILEKPCNVVHQ